jgi:NADPH-dependent curcumin reductase CurA
MVSGYQDGSAWTGKAAPPEAATLPARLLEKSASVRGFFLPHFPQQARAHTAALLRSAQQGSLQCLVDPRIFAGLEAVPDAVEYMYSGASQGKVVVHVAPARAGRL